MVIMVKSSLVFAIKKVIFTFFDNSYKISGLNWDENISNNLYLWYNYICLVVYNIN